MFPVIHPLPRDHRAILYNAHKNSAYAAAYEATTKGKDMGNIVDYVRACQETFDAKPLNRVDSLVFAWLTFLRIPEEAPAACATEGMTLVEIATQIDSLSLTATAHDPARSENLLLACATSPRYSGVRACLAVDEWSRKRESQFSAVTFILPEKRQGAVVAFRGTDNTLVGWKECFNMAFSSTVPAQDSAREYLEHVALLLEMPLYVTGHSKGGNLAMYATMTCADNVRARIVRCYSHDGPGFSEQVMADSRWATDLSTIERIVPEESLVGMLLSNTDTEPLVVRSTNPGIMQHSPFSWVVEGDDFVLVRSVTYDSYRRGKRLNIWLASMILAERERVVETLYKLVQATGETTTSGLLNSLSDGSLDLMLRRLDGLPEDERTFFLNAMSDLAATMLLGPAPTNPQTPTERMSDAASRIEDATAKFNDRMSRWEKYLS